MFQLLPGFENQRNAPRQKRNFWCCCLLSALLLLATACSPYSDSNSSASVKNGHPSGTLAAEKVLRVPMPTDGPKTLDPVRGSTLYENVAGSQVFETLLQYKYLMRPPELEPLLLAEMPQVSEDRLVYNFKLKQGVHFHDDPCFPEGKGPELRAEDVIYSWKRMADNANDPKSWWLMENTIAGFDEYRKQQNKAAKFDYDAPVSGLEILGKYEFRVTLKEPVQRFMWVLAMYQLSIVPREAVELYGERFGRHPVGTGPFVLAEEDWLPRQQMNYRRNPNYHKCYYPNEHLPEDEKLGLHLAAGQRLPLVDRLEIRMFVHPQPQWLRFRSGRLDYTGVPAEIFPEAFIKRLKQLKPAMVREGITAQSERTLDFIFIGFNMEDKLLGGYTPEKKALRQALSLAMDWQERNDAFYNGLNIIYDGPIPPGLDGYPPEGIAPNNYRGPNIPRAKELLAKSGYPNGEGLPAIEYYIGQGGNSQEQVEMFARHLARIGVKIQPRQVDFSTLISNVAKRKAPMFSFAWGSDYPDAENNLALFYSPNASPGSNHYNYKKPAYDKLYEQIRSMAPSPERTKIYEQMRDMVIEDTPFLGSMSRENYYLIGPRLKNMKATDIFTNWYKYLDVEEE